MNKTIIAAAVLAALSASAFATCGPSCAPVATSVANAHAAGSNSIISGSAAVARSSGNGTSYSFGSNMTTASTRVGATADAVADRTVDGKICTTTLGGKVGVNGLVTTSSSSVAFNVSTGAGTGGAVAGGAATAHAAGAGAFEARGAHGMIAGAAAGAAEAHSANGIIAGTNQGASAYGATFSSFDTAARGEIILESKKTGFGRCGVTCGTPYADFKIAETTNVAVSTSEKETFNGLFAGDIKLGNALVVNATGGNANAVSNVHGFARVSTSAHDADFVLGARGSN